jgi:hypothetical protein
METESEVTETSKIIILHAGSFELKIGLSNSDPPISSPHCLIDFRKSEPSENHYYEEIIVSEEELTQINNQKLKKLKNLKELSNRKNQKEKFSVKEFKQENETILENEWIGENAIQYYKREKNGNLFYPLKSGYFNTSKDRSLLYVSDCLEKIWRFEIEKLIPKNEIQVTLHCVKKSRNLLFYSFCVTDTIQWN